MTPKAETGSRCNWLSPGAHSRIDGVLLHSRRRTGILDASVQASSSTCSSLRALRDFERDSRLTNSRTAMDEQSTARRLRSKD